MYCPTLYYNRQDQETSTDQLQNSKKTDRGKIPPTGKGVEICICFERATKRCICGRTCLGPRKGGFYTTSEQNKRTLGEG